MKTETESNIKLTMAIQISSEVHKFDQNAQHQCVVVGYLCKCMGATCSILCEYSIVIGFVWSLVLNI